MAISYIDEADIAGKRVLARFDFNVPLDKDGVITDTSRIDLALQTIQCVLDKGASKLILMGHLGRPKGQHNPKYSLEPVAKYLAKTLDRDVHLTSKAVDAGIENLLRLKETQVVLLENLRFHAQETADDHAFAKELSQYGDIYVNDAFGAAHRKHASVHQINTFFKGQNYAGLLMKKEIQALSKITEGPQRPFMAIVGGAKVADKINTLDQLLPQVDALFIGGAMAYPFLKAKGHEVGKSLCADDDVALAKRILQRDVGNKIKLPIDHVVASDLDGPGVYQGSVDIDDDKMGMDIGELTVQSYEKKLASAKTILWNGPMGLFENPHFANGTQKIAHILANCDAFSVVGGGDSVSAISQLGLRDKLSHVSTGGGASLEFIEKGQLPGIQALKFGPT